MRPSTLWRVIGLVLVGFCIVPTSLASAFEWAGRLRVTAQKLKHPKTSVRLQGVQELGELSIGETRPHLLRAMADETDEVRLAAAAILVEHRVSEMLPTLVEWLSDFETKVRVEAVRFLGRLANPEAVGPLIRTFGDAEQEVRMEAVLALGRIGSRKAVTGVIGRLNDSNVKVREAAIGVLADLTDTRSVIPLLGKLNDPSPEIRQAAIRALTRIGDLRAVPSILRMLRDPTPKVRIEAIASLGQLRVTSAVAALAEAFGRSRNLEERRALVKTLGLLGTPQGRSTLLEALSDPGLMEAVRDAMVSAGADIVPMLTQALSSPRIGKVEAEVMVGVLRDIGDRRASPALVREFRRGLVSRTLVVDALATCGDTAAIIPLLRVLEGENLEEKRLALKALEPMVDRRAIGPLLPLLRAKEADLRLTAARILGRLQAREAIPALLSQLEGEDAIARREIVSALGSIGDPKVGGALLPQLDTSDLELRRAVINALANLRPLFLMKDLMARATGSGADGDGQRRLVALDAVAAILRGRPAKEWLTPLLRLVSGGSHGMATAALTVMAASGDLRFAAPLCPLLSKAPAALVPKLLETLGYLPHECSTAHLLTSLRSQDWKLRAVSAWALGRPGHRGAEAALVKALGDVHGAVRTNSAGALALSPPKETTEPLGRMLRETEPDPFLMANVVTALAALSHRESGDSIARLLSSDRANPHLDRSVLRALHRLGRPVSELRGLIASRKDESLDELLDLLESRASAGSPPTWIGLDLLDAKGARRRGEAFLLILSDGRVRWAFSDERGQAFEERIPAGIVYYEQVTSQMLR